MVGVAVTVAGVALVQYGQPRAAFIVLMIAAGSSAVTLATKHRRHQQLSADYDASVRKAESLELELKSVKGALKDTQDRLRDTEAIRARLEPLVEMHDLLAAVTRPFLATAGRTMDLDTAIEGVLDAFNYLACRVFSPHGPGVGVAVFYPDPKNADHLKIWHQQGVPPHGINALFYAGPDTNRLKSEGGLAGWSYAMNELLITSITEIVEQPKGGRGGRGRTQTRRRYEATDERFKFLGGKGTDPKFRSLAAVPITDHDKKPVAVLCVHSDSSTSFDDPDAAVLLESLARAVAVPILIYNRRLRFAGSLTKTSGG